MLRCVLVWEGMRQLQAALARDCLLAAVLQRQLGGGWLPNEATVLTWQTCRRCRGLKLSLRGCTTLPHS